MSYLDRMLERMKTRPLFEKFFEEYQLRRENLSEEQRKIVESFAQGISTAINMPSSNIDKDMLATWIFDFARAFVRPEDYDKTIAPSEHLMTSFGVEIGNIIRLAIEKLDDQPEVEQPAQDPEVPPPVSPPAEEPPPKDSIILKSGDAKSRFSLDG